MLAEEAAVGNDAGEVREHVHPIVDEMSQAELRRMFALLAALPTEVQRPR